MKRKMPLIKQVMTAFPYSVDGRATLSEARSMMIEHRIRHLPVTEGNHQILGIISERDVAVAYSLGSHVTDPEKLSVDAICSKEPFVVEMHADVARVAQEMAERHIGSALVVREGKLAGIFTSTDCSRFLGQLLNDLYGSDADGEPEAA